MSVNPFSLPGQWYRGNTHTHTTESDGQLTVAERCAAYRAAGYQFLFITDHGRVSDVSGMSDADFLALPGSELHPANPYGGTTYHLVGLNLSSPVDVAEMHPNEVIAAVKAQGGEVIIAHPYWCGHTLLDHRDLVGYLGVEVFNGTCVRFGKGTSEESWDALLDRIGLTYGIACDDAHTGAEDCFQGWINVKAPALTPDAIMSALRDGAFYASTGPEIHDITLTTEETADGPRTTVSVASSPARTISILSNYYLGWSFTPPAGETSITSATNTLPKEARYVRVEVIDAQGRKAWSNPLAVG